MLYLEWWFDLDGITYCDVMGFSIIMYLHIFRIFWIISSPFSYFFLNVLYAVENSDLICFCKRLMFFPEFVQLKIKESLCCLSYLFPFAMNRNTIFEHYQVQRLQKDSQFKNLTAAISNKMYAFFWNGSLFLWRHAAALSRRRFF